MLILAKMGLKCSLRGLKFQKFSGGACPQTPLEMVVFYCKIGLYPPQQGYAIIITYSVVCSIHHTNTETERENTDTDTHTLSCMDLLKQSSWLRMRRMISNM